MPSRIFPTDEELGKRDDDHRPSEAHVWITRNIPVRYRRRRAGVVILACFVVWLLLRLLSTNGSSLENADYARPGRIGGPQGSAPRAPGDEDSDAAKHYYNGHIKFFELGKSLHEITTTKGLREKNRNVLFAASNLKSVSAMLPLACEMAKWNRSYVHFVIMGRYDIPLNDILEVNGVDRSGCDVYWHDARPDYVLYSSDVRAEAVVIAAMGHIQVFMHPQVVITDDSVREDPVFVRGMKTKTREQGLPVIEIPRNRAETLEWLTRLDSGSLKSWHKPSVDILVHAPPDSSGSLLRLIKSIKAADYAGLTPPRIIVELPVDIDPPTQSYLDNLVWPPSSGPTPLKPHANQVILRHRIPNERISSEEASIRFLESFYPSPKADSHVLLLSPSAELSPLYYHYLMFHVLEYKYSAYVGDTNDGIFGVSLEVPVYYLNGTTAFEQPTIDSMRDEQYRIKGHQDAAAPFTWPSTNSNAALYFGDKLDKFHALVTIHNELYTPPEDVLREGKDQESDDATEPDPVDTNALFLTGTTDITPPTNPEPPLAQPAMPLHHILPFDADPPELTALPFLSHTGALLEPDEMQDMAAELTRKFREAIGGCAPVPEGKKRKVVQGSARDLFCFGDEGEEIYEASERLKKDNKKDEGEVGGKASGTKTEGPQRTYMGEVLAAPSKALEGAEDSDDADKGDAENADGGEKGTASEKDTSSKKDTSNEKGL